MNAERRKALNVIRENLVEAQSALESLRDEEQEYFDNMPESLQGGDKGSKAEAAISEMDEAISCLESALSSVETAAE